MYKMIQVVILIFFSLYCLNINESLVFLLILASGLLNL